jgi:hypothetical protein
MYRTIFEEHGAAGMECVCSNDGRRRRRGAKANGLRQGRLIWLCPVASVSVCRERREGYLSVTDDAAEPPRLLRTLTVPGLLGQLS